jgi:hypothetical protein
VNAIKLAAVIQLVLIVTLWGMRLSWTTSCDARLSQQIQDLQQSFNFQIQHIQSGIEAASPAWSCCHSVAVGAVGVPVNAGESDRTIAPSE